MTRTFRAVLVASAVLGAGPAWAGPLFILNDIGGVGLGTQARAGFEAAAGLWSSVLSSDVTVRLDVGFQKLGTGILGSTGSNESDIGYGAVRSALGGHATSATDTTAAASLAPTLSFISNEKGNCATGVGCGAISTGSRTLDNDDTRDNNYLSVNGAVAKVLGLAADGGRADASITFSNAFTWDFDRADGVTSRTYDFVGIAAHEIGHALGFVSGVDLVDANIGASGLDNIAWGTVLDLFRYRNGKRDWTVGSTPCLSVDAGAHCAGRLATGVNKGDHRQASHWKDNLGIGIMDPTAGPGELLTITTADLTAFDAIGWSLAGSPALSRVQWGAADPTAIATSYSFAPVPEAATSAALLGGLGLLGLARRQRARMR